MAKSVTKKKAAVKRPVQTNNGIADYVERLQLLREIISGDSQRDFAQKIGIDLKRWNNFERGFPVPRDVAIMIVDNIPGVSVDWIWFGWPNNLSQEMQTKIEAHKPKRACAIVKVPHRPRG